MPLAVKDSCALFERDAADFPVLRQDFLRSPAVLHIDSFRPGFLDFLPGCPHLIRRLEAEHRHLVRAGADSCPCDIDRDIASSDDNRAPRKADGMVVVDSSEEIDAGLDAFRVLTRHTGFSAALHPDGQEECLVSLLPELLNSRILSDLHAALKLYAHLTQDINLRIQHILLQTEARDAIGQHTARRLLLLKDSDRIAFPSEEVGSRHSGRTCPDHGDLLREELALAVFAQRDIATLRLQLLCCQELLDLVDRQRLVDGASRAAVLAASVADRPAHRRERIVLLDQLQRIQISPLCGHFDVALNGKMHRTGCLAG